MSHVEPANTPSESMEGHGVARNAMFLLAGKLVSTILGVTFVVYIAVKLGVSQFGIYTLANYFAGFFVIFSDLGISNFTTREIARNRSQAQEIINHGLGLKLVLSLCALIIGILVLLQIDYGEFTQQLTIIVLFTQIFFRSFLSYLFHIFEGYERMEFVSLAEAVRRCIDLAVGISILSNGLGISELIIGLVVSDLIILVLTWIMFTRSFRVRLKLVFSWKEWSNTLRTSIPFGLLLVFLGVINSIDTAMLGKMRTEDEVGLYGAVIRITSVLTILPMMAASAMFPATSRLFMTSADDARSIFKALIRLMIFIGLPLAVGTLFIGSTLITFIYNMSYLPAALPLKIVIWSIATAFLNLPMVMFLSSIEQQKQATIILGAGAFCNFLLNWILIPQYGMTGAAVTTVASQIIILILSYMRIIKFLKRLEWQKFFFQAGGGCLCMAAVLSVLPALHPVIMILAGVLTYSIIMILIGAINRDDVLNFRRLLNPNI